ncbi:hypothetical protein CAOG_03130 [Capsaspora owczarzaki ATCC 30864]|uniref:hypothetical protein n=1 Tax=Capsaspora owczarzaki (strain ATCC 30864) TaxID=595528 RepID=UPI0001FE63C3|nr:hypothetical protein CAOG_03130 [Capsaspora owczarzaki ATCC 30864]|eukprot:XP_004363969.1 hypothetical protein CAOG_03130 [Capsaspora owczarzaki ATCC 30864]
MADAWLMIAARREMATSVFDAVRSLFKDPLADSPEIDESLLTPPLIDALVRAFQPGEGFALTAEQRNAFLVLVTALELTDSSVLNK